MAKGAVITASPKKVGLGQDVQIRGTGLPPAKHGVVVDDVTGQPHEVVYDAYVSVAVTYEDSSEMTKAVVGWDGHPKYKAGEISFTVTARRPGKAKVVVWDWSQTTELAETSFEVSDG